MTSLPAKSGTKKLGLVVDLDTCVGCHACSVACKGWNDAGPAGPPGDADRRGARPRGVWFSRVHAFEAGLGAAGRTVYFPTNCLHCEDAACVTVCPTGASFKRRDDGIVLIDRDKCIGCKLCAWACPYGARDYDEAEGVMKKCTLCIDRIYDAARDEADRAPACVATCPAGARHFGDFNDPNSTVSRLVRERGELLPLPEIGYRPTSRYLPPRPARAASRDNSALKPRPGGLLAWLDRAFLR